MVSHKKSPKHLVLKPLESEKSGRILFLACFICYFLFAGTRNFYPQAMAALIPEGVFTKDIAGIAASAYSIAYGVGMFVNGLLSERVHPFKFIGLSMFLTAAGNAVLYATSVFLEPNIIVFTVTLTLSGFAQAIAWPTMIRTVSTLMPEKKRVTASANMYIASTSSGIFAYLFSQQMLRMFTWEALFMSSAVIGLAVFLFWIISTRGISKHCISYGTVSRKDDTATDTDHTKNSASLISLMMMAGGVFIIISIAFKALAYDGFANWLPTMLAESFNIKADMSVMMSTLIPLCNLAGVILGRALLSAIFRNEVAAAAVFTILGAAGFTMMAIFGFNSIVEMVILLAVIFPIVAASSTMYISLVPLRFARYGKSGSVAGLLNAICSGCSGVSAYMIGVLAENFDWKITLAILAAMLVLSSIFSIMNIKKFGKFRNM